MAGSEIGVPAAGPTTARHGAGTAGPGRWEQLKPLKPRFGLGLALQKATFRNCLQCTACTNVCPVAALSPDLAGHLHSAPQQVMNLLRMGLVRHALASDMIWSCTTCYKCSEYCPQDIPVADVMFELRNMALECAEPPAKRRRP